VQLVSLGADIQQASSWLARECKKLIYVRCISRQCSKSAEAELARSLQLFEEDNQEAAGTKCGISDSDE